MMNESNLLRIAVSIILTLALVFGAFLVLEPFILPIAWAVVLVLATWPLYRRLSELWPGRPRRSAAVMTVSLALLLIALVAPILVSLSHEVDTLTVRLKEGAGSEPPVLPEAISALPYIGPIITDRFTLLWSSRGELVDTVGEYQEPLVKIATGVARGVFSSLFTLFMCLIVAFFLYENGPTLARQVRMSGEQIGGERFERLLDATRETISGAVYGVLLTAFAQGILAGIGYIAAGAPTPILLGFITMVMSLIPFGTPLVYIPVAIITVANGAPWIYGVLLIAWGVGVVSTSDNVIRPMFISASTNMPIIISFIGVVGGLVSFGLIGIILGPALLAIAMVLWRDWIQHCEAVTIGDPEGDVRAGA